MSDRGVEVGQAVACVAGVTVGVVLLVRVALGGEVGRWLSWVPGTGDTPWSWLVPVAVVLLALAAVLGLARLDD